jgi:hypothetical protein
MKGIVKDLDRGFYHEARGKNVTALSYLAQMINPEPDEVKPIREQLYDRYPLVRHSGGVYRQTVDEFAVQLCALGKAPTCRKRRSPRPAGAWRCRSMGVSSRSLTKRLG